LQKFFRVLIFQTKGVGFKYRFTWNIGHFRFGLDYLCEIWPRLSRRRRRPKNPGAVIKKSPKSNKMGLGYLLISGNTHYRK